MKLFSALHFPCIVSFLLVLLVNITCIAEQVYFVFQQFREKKKKVSALLMCFGFLMM